MESFLGIHMHNVEASEISHDFYFATNESDCVQDFHIKIGCTKNICTLHLLYGIHRMKREEEKP